MVAYCKGVLPQLGLGALACDAVRDCHVWATCSRAFLHREDGGKGLGCVFQEWLQVSLLFSSCHRDGRHDEGLLALGQREGHGAAAGAASAQPKQPFLCLAQVLSSQPTPMH